MKKKSTIRPLRLNRDGQIIKPRYNSFYNGGNITPINAGAIMSTIAGPHKLTNPFGVGDIKDPRGSTGGGMDFGGFGAAQIQAGADLLGNIIGMSQANVDPLASANLQQAQNFTTLAQNRDDLMNEGGSHVNMGHISRKQAGGKDVGGMASGIASGAASGAAIGSVVPGIGTAIGAGVGAVGSLVSGLFGNKSAKRKQRRMNAKIDEANQFAQDSFINRADAIDVQAAHNLEGNYFEDGGYLTPQSGWGNQNIFNTPQIEPTIVENPYYNVQSGDNLSTIANKHNVSIDDILQLNQLSDPNKIYPDQKLMMPEQNVQNVEASNIIQDDDIQEPDIAQSQYTIQKGDNLTSISKKLNIPIKDLQNFNNISNPNLINEGDVLNYATPVKGEWSYTRNELDDLNKNLSNKDKIITFQKKARPNEIYVVEDKKNHNVNIYRGDKKIKTYNSATGKNKGDALTITKTNDRGQLLQGQGNMSTPAGVFQIGGKGTFGGVPSFVRTIPDKTLERGDGEVVPFDIPSSIHAGYVPQNKEKCNISNGCTRLSNSDLKDLNKYIDVGTNYYILPEDENNNFNLRGSGLHFSSSDESQLSSYNPKRTMRDVKIDVEIDNKSQEASLSDNVTQMANYIKKAITGIDSKSVDVYVKTYEKDKKQLLDDLNINTDTYDILAELSLGIMGQESGFGNPGMRGIYGGMRDMVGMALDKNVSVGPSQIRITSIPKQIRDKYNIQKTKDLTNPRKSAIASIAILADIRKYIVPNLQKQYPDLSAEELTILAYQNPQQFREGNNLNTQYLNNVKNKLEKIKSTPGNVISNFALGGQLNQFAMGGEFDSGINMIDAGGTHEENPMGGVMMGMDQEGTPNMVEEGEVIYDDYVFSNRVYADKDILEQNLLNKNHDGKTFAKIAEDISLEYEERPNDPIAKRGLKIEMTRLIAAQEAQKQQDEEAEFGEQLAMAAQGIAPEGMSPEEQPMDQMQMEDPNMMGGMDLSGLEGMIDPMGEEGMQPMAFGGNLNSKMKSMSPTSPTNLQPSKFNHQNMFAYGGPTIQSGIFNDPYFITGKGDFRIYGDTYAGFDNLGYVDAYPENATPQQIRAIDRYDFLNTERLVGEGKTIMYPYGEYKSVINNRSRGPYDNSSTPMKGQAARDHAEIQRNNSTQVGNTGAGNTKSPQVSPQVSPYIPLSLPPQNKYASVTKGNPSEVSLPSDHYTLYSELVDERRLRDYNKSQQEKGFGMQNLRYVPAIGAAAMSITDAFGLTNKPDYSHADMVAKSGTTREYTPNPLGNYMTYTPFDRNYQQNKLNAQAGASRRAITDQAGGNRGVAMAGIMGLDNMAQQNMGELGIQADAYNQQQKQNVEQFNTGINQFNAQQAMQAFQMNAQQDQINQRAQIMAAQMRQQADMGADAGRAANLSNMLQSIGDIGRESFAREMIMSNPALYYSIDSNGKVSYKNGYDKLPAEQKSIVDQHSKIKSLEAKNKSLEDDKKARETSNNSKAKGGKINRYKRIR